jgi:hypothetical protein
VPAVGCLPGAASIVAPPSLVARHRRSEITAKQVALIVAGLAATQAGTRLWGVCTECGMGRADRADVPALLDLHAEIIAGHSTPTSG